MKVSTRILITAIAGGLTYVLTNATGQPEIWQLTMSVFVGGIVLVVQVLIDYDNRMLQFAAAQATHARRTEEIVDRRFAAISAATALYASVEATALKVDNVTGWWSRPPGSGRTPSCPGASRITRSTGSARCSRGCRTGWPWTTARTPTGCSA